MHQSKATNGCRWFEAFNDAMFIILSMHQTTKIDLGSVALQWMQDADRRPQTNWDMKKYTQQRYLSNFSGKLVEEIKHLKL